MNTDYTTTSAGTVFVGKSVYKVEHTYYHETETTQTSLKGPRGAIYILRPVYKRGEDGKLLDTGYRRAYSFFGGQAMRRQGNEVFFFQVGDLISYLGWNI